MTNDDQANIDRGYLLGERRAILLRLSQVEDLLTIPRSVIPKKLRRPWKEFLEEHRGVMLNDYPDDENGEDLEVDKS